MATAPNIIVIVADDMGYGDVTALNPESKIPTLHLDAMAASGIAFRNAHAMSSACTPSRYGLLTGRYCWRSRLKSSIVWDWDSSLIEKGRTTMASLLKRQGYGTACIGKWDLGWDWKDTDGHYVGASLPFVCMDNASRRAVDDRIQLDQPWCPNHR